MMTVCNVELTLDQLLTAIRHLDEAGRIEVARALLETKMDADLAKLIDRLAKTAPSDDMSDSEIDAEVKAVRRAAK